MSSSTEPRAVLRGATAAGASALATPELRAGSWTRLGQGSVLGDTVTEQTLSGLAESTRSAARAQGYTVGWAEGRREAATVAARDAEAVRVDREAAEARREAEHREALSALADAAAEMQTALATLSARVEEHALALARELTTELVGHELRSSEDPGADVVRRALAVLSDGLPVTLRMHPEVLGSASLEQLAAHGVRVLPDPTLRRGDALLETDEDVVDLRVEAALARVRDVLR